LTMCWIDDCKLLSMMWFNTSQ